MKIEDQVCAIEYSKRLEELGVKQDSLYMYVQYLTDNSFDIKTDLGNHEDNYLVKRVASAFTVAELGLLIPPYIEKDNKTYWCHFNIQYIEYITRDGNYDDLGFAQRDNNEANARAKMLIYLLENGLIKCV